MTNLKNSTKKSQTLRTVESKLTYLWITCKRYVSKKIKSLKNSNESYASVFGANNVGKVLYKPQTFKKTLGIRIRGINESKSKEAADRLEDLCHVTQILEHLNIEDRKITKLVRLGKYKSENKRERVILVHTASKLSRDLILKSVSRLKN